MKQIITILNQDGEPYSGIEADVKQGIAIHKDVFGGNYYSVTHVKSGGRFKRSMSKTNAKAFCDKLLAIEIGGVRLGDMSGCEICANALLIAERINLTVDMDAVNNAAEILCKVK